MAATPALLARLKAGVLTPKERRLLLLTGSPIYYNLIRQAVTS